MKWVGSVLFWFGLLVTGSAEAAPVILVFGDSLSAGYGLSASQSWPSLLQKRLTTERKNYFVVNASISGETSAGGLSRLPIALAQHQPAIVIIELGANDGLRGLAVQDMQKNLNRMVALAKQHHAKVLLIGVRLPPNYGMDYTQKFQQVFVAVAHQQKVAFLPSLLNGIETNPALFQADGFHPIASAELTVLDTVWHALLPLLKH